MAIYQPPYYGQQYGSYLPSVGQQMPMQQNVMPQYNAAPAANTGLIWVQGETGAKSYLVAPGNTVPLWDSENQTIYLKTTDPSGMPTMKILDYTERTQGAKQPPAIATMADYIRREEFDQLKAIVEQMKGVTKNGEPAV